MSNGGNDSPCQVCNTNNYPPIQKCDDSSCEIHLCDRCTLQCKKCKVPLCVDHSTDCWKCADCVFCQVCLDKHTKSCVGPPEDAQGDV